MFSCIKRGIPAWLLRLAVPCLINLLCLSQVEAQSQVDRCAQSLGVSSWKRFHSTQGNCSINFPMQPKHVRPAAPVVDGKETHRCDIYVAPSPQRAVYMMLIAQHPTRVDATNAKLVLEGMLNGLLKQNRNGQLKFVDLVEVAGYQGLDFFIESEGTYLKGRVIVTDKNLYLLAMKCDQRNYSQDHYQKFIHSFQLSRV